MRTFLRVGLGALLLFACVEARADHHYGMAGCGLGSLIFKANSGKSLQIFASTTNGIYWNNTFGITSGTSNCTAGKNAEARLNQEQFMSVNFASVQKEVAQGEGESLQALASTFGCQNDVQGQFNAAMQASHEAIFAAPGAVAALEVARQHLASDDKLVAKCNMLNI